MWRFPTLFAGMIALSLPSTGAFGNDVAPRHASPPSAPSVPTQGSSDSDASAHQAERNSAAYLQRQVSTFKTWPHPSSSSWDSARRGAPAQTLAGGKQRLTSQSKRMPICSDKTTNFTLNCRV